MERFIVVASLIIMTIAAFMKVLSDFLAKHEAGAVFYLVVTLAFFTIARVSTSASPKLQGQSLAATVWALVGTALSVGYVWLIQTQQSSVALALTSVAAAVVVVGMNVAAVRDGDRWSIGRIANVVAALALCALIVKLALGFQAGLGYSWAPNIALTLLLWMAFLGASMATHEKRHLGLDAVRKLIPSKHTRLYAGLSFLASGLVTAAFFYLAWTYFGKRFGEEPEPGKIPDWIKVLSVPVALGLMSARFLAYSLAEIVGYALNVPPEEPPAPTLPPDEAPSERAEEVPA